MKKVIILLIGMLSFYSCDKANKVPYNGILKGTIKYTGGASNMELDNVIVTLRQIGKSAEEGTWRIDKSGDYELKNLPAGEYVLKLEGNRVKSDEDADIIKINVGNTTQKNINIERLYYSMIVKYRGKEFEQGDTIKLGSIDALDIVNKYSSNTLEWNIQVQSSVKWVTFPTPKGTIPQGEQRSITFELYEDEMPKFGWNYTNVVLTTPSDYGAVTVIVGAYKESGEPEKAMITGSNENVCPAPSVILTANAISATSYKWYKGSSIISGENGNTYTVTQNGTYYAVGVNTNGTGNQSDGKAVTISTCVDVPAIATISGNSTNSCSGANGLTVTLMASATRATNYTWRKGNEQLNETGNTLMVSETGTYYAKGINVSGTGQESIGKAVTITSCIPVNPTNVKVDEFIYTSMAGSKIKLSWNNTSSATQHKIQVCDNPAMNQCEYNYSTTTNNYYYFYPNDLPCGQTYFKIIAVNSFGESSGIPFSYMMPVSITATDALYLSYNSATQAYILSYIDAVVKWYEGTIYFEIQRKEDNGHWQVIGTITGNTNESITTMHSYQDYTYSRDAEALEYRVRAYINTNCGVIEDYAY